MDRAARRSSSSTRNLPAAAGGTFEEIHMKTVSLLRAALAVTVLLMALCATGATGGRSVAAGRGQVYRVYCVNEKVSFGTRTVSEMQWDYGKNVCVLATYPTYAEAKEDVRRRGGVGAGCKSQECQKSKQD
jgi:hypothetical protein